MEVFDGSSTTVRRSCGATGDEVAGSPHPPRQVEQEFWRRIAEGMATEDAGAAAGVSSPVAYRWFRRGGGMPPITLDPPSGRYLSLAEREEIAILNAQAVGCP